MTTGELLARAWDADPIYLGAAVVATVMYVRAYAARGLAAARPACFCAAVALFVVALVSPIGVLSRGYLFSAHMLQHLILVLVVPPLALMGVPPSGEALAPGPNVRSRSPVEGARAVVPWLLGVSAMWLWHAPTLCDAAASSGLVQHAQTASLLVMGGAFWWPIFGPRRAHLLAPFAAIVYLFTACVACTILGIVVTFSPVEVCSIFAHPVDRVGAMPLLRGAWGMSPAVDQQIGGLFMWVPACLVYAIAILGTLARYYGGEHTDADDGSLPALPKGVEPEEAA